MKYTNNNTETPKRKSDTNRKVPCLDIIHHSGIHFDVFESTFAARFRQLYNNHLFIRPGKHFRRLLCKIGKSAILLNPVNSME